jgi:hypothetical protein
MRRRCARFTRAKCEAVAGVVAAGSSFGSAENRGQFLPSQLRGTIDNAGSCGRWSGTLRTVAGPGLCEHERQIMSQKAITSVETRNLDESATSLFVLPINEQQHVAIARLLDAPDGTR